MIVPNIAKIIIKNIFICLILSPKRPCPGLNTWNKASLGTNEITFVNLADNRKPVVPE